MTSQPTRETITSADGTQITYERMGSGPPLVQSGGNRPPFGEQCTVYVFDTSDRLGSGDVDESVLERQCEDVVAIVDSIDEPVSWFGHSIGALRSLEAALRTDNLRTLVLYEPPLLVSDHHPYTGDFLAEMRALYDDGEYERVLVLFFREIVGLTPAEIDERRSNWQDGVEDTVHSLFGVAQLISEYEFDATRFDEVNTPTLLLVGSESPQWFKDATDAVDDALPNSRIAVLDGQAHFGMNTAPEPVMDEVLPFIREAR